MCFDCSKDPSHRDSSFEYPQHMFWLRNKKSNFHLHTLIWGQSLEWLKIVFILEKSADLNERPNSTALLLTKVPGLPSIQRVKKKNLQNILSNKCIDYRLYKTNP